MTQLEQKIKQVSNLYFRFKKEDDELAQKQMLIKLDKLCSQTYDLLENSSPTPENERRMKQLKIIQDKVTEEQIKNRQKYKKMQIPKQQVCARQKIINSKGNMSREQMSKYIARSIAMQQIKSSQFKVSDKQLQDLAQRMQNNKDVMQQIEGMINDHGQNLDLIQSNIMHAYDQTKEANKELDQAVNLQTQTRLRKIRLGLGSILAALGYTILGIPGMILGLFAGWKTTK